MNRSSKLVFTRERARRLLAGTVPGLPVAYGIFGVEGW